MTATQVFLLFLKKECDSKEYAFFREIITSNPGNVYFKKRKLFTKTFVEDYLSNNNRALNNFMMRLFLLAPNLKRYRCRNPRYLKIREDWRFLHEGKRYEFGHSGNLFRVVRWNEEKGAGMYCVYYRRLWNKFLKEYIDESNKKFKSPFKKGETYDFKLKKSLIE